MSLPKHIKRRGPMYGDHYGYEYHKPDGTPLYANMRGGWEPAELRAIADDIEAIEAAKEKT